MSDKLEFTGERFTPECVREIRYEHFHRYAFARALVRDRTVLDAACGEGYGSALLAEVAATVTGVDLAAAAVEHARARYRAANLDFLQADCLDLPFGDGAFDCIVSFETLEHLAEQDSLLREFRRVLSPNGFLLLSSPDKAVYNAGQAEPNPYHVKELGRGELESLLREHFPAYRLWGQKLLFQSAIWPLADQPSGSVRFEQEDEGALSTAAEPRHAPVYYLALCAAEEADLPRPAAEVSLFDDAGESVYAHYYHEIRKNMAAGELLAARDCELERLRAELERCRRRPWWSRWVPGQQRRRQDGDDS